MVENYAYKIFPDCIKKDALDNLKEYFFDVMEIDGAARFLNLAMKTDIQCLSNFP